MPGQSESQQRHSQQNGDVTSKVVLDLGVATASFTTMVTNAALWQPPPLSNSFTSNSVVSLSAMSSTTNSSIPFRPHYGL